VIERTAFGRTGHLSSRVVFGAAALWRMPQERADELLAVLLEFGVNHLDVAASYGDAELRLAPWLAAHPGEFFVATKTGERTGDGARAGLERSLERLGVDHVDLIQLHNLVEVDEWEAAFAPGGAVEALARARDEGLARFVGVTGHGLRVAGMHRRSLERFDFDSVLLPYGWVLLRDDAYRADVEAVLATCGERRVAVQAIKAVARRRWAHGDGPRNSWYEPATAPRWPERSGSCWPSRSCSSCRRATPPSCGRSSRPPRPPARRRRRRRSARTQPPSTSARSSTAPSSSASDRPQPTSSAAGSRDACSLR
jgi:aryl-alcohol dehydrogenase-like predicted oxidoreductase